MAVPRRRLERLAGQAGCFLGIAWQLPRWRRSQRDRHTRCTILTVAAHNFEPGEPSQSLPLVDPAAPSPARWHEWSVAALLLALGVYQSILFFGHTPVPHPDMPHFVRVGHDLLAFELPGSLKRLPVVGLLQAGLSHVVGGPHPELTAGWLANALLHPFSLLLVWLVGRRLVGTAAVWIALITAINPWVVQALTEAIAESILLFLGLSALYAMLCHSRWRYVLASIASMARYDMAAVLVLVVITDWITCTSRRGRLRALLYGAIASLPLALWLLATLLTFGQQPETHYLKVIGSGGNVSAVLRGYVTAIWGVTFYPLLVPPPFLPAAAVKMFYVVGKCVAVGGFALGVGYAIRRRRWDVACLLIFLVSYLLVHVISTFIYHRYCAVISWIPLLVCCYGLRELAATLTKRRPLPRTMGVALQVCLLVLVTAWAIWLASYLPGFVEMSRRSASLPLVAAGAIGVVLGVRLVAAKGHRASGHLAAAALTVLMVVSNQFVLAQHVGNGNRDIEFKHLLDWYQAHAEPGEKMLCTLSEVLAVMSPAQRDCFVRITRVNGETADEIADSCRRKGIRYVAWDSRLGLRSDDLYYKRWRLDRLAALAYPSSVGPYEFVARLGRGRRFIHVFRVDPAADVRTTEPAAPE